MGLSEAMPGAGFVLADGSRVTVKPAVRMAALRSQGSQRRRLNRRAWGEVDGKARAVLEARRRMSDTGTVPVRDPGGAVKRTARGPTPLTGDGEQSPSPQAGSTPAASRPHAAGWTPVSAMMPTKSDRGSP